MRGNLLAGTLFLLSLVLSPAASLHYFGGALAGPTQETAKAGQIDDADTARLKNALSNAATVLKSGKGELKTVNVQSPISQQNIVSGVYVSEAALRIEAGKEVLLAGLSSPNLEGIKAHVEQFYPRPQLEVVAYDHSYKGHSIELIAVASEESVEAAFAAANAYIGLIAAVVVKPQIDLEVRTTERLATCRLSAGMTLKREVVTNDTAKNLPRGLYTYVVTQDGYKTATGLLDLIKDDGTLLDCTMFKETDNGGSSKCQFR